MKTKILSLFAFTILAIVLVSSFALAADLITVSPTSPLQLTKQSPAKTFTITANDDVNLSLASSVLTGTDSNGKKVTVAISPALPSTLSASTTPYTYTLTASPEDGLELGSYTMSLTLNSTNASDSTISALNTIKFDFTSDFCDINNSGELEISGIELNVVDGFGSDDDYWYPFDEVEIVFDVENTGDWDIRDIAVDICVYDNTKGKCVIDERDMDLSDDKFDIDYKDNEVTVKATYTVDPNDLTEGNTDYTVFIKATGQINDRDSLLHDKENTCAGSSADIEIRTDESFVIINNFDLPDVVQCGETFTVSADVWNIGDSKIDQEDIFVYVYIEELKIAQTIDLDDISSMSRKTIDVEFTIPSGSTAKTYPIKFEAYDREKFSDRDVYINSEDDEAIYTAYIPVVCSSSPTASGITSISASLDSEAKAGEELVISSVITSNMNTAESFIVSPINYDSWATLSSVSERVITLPSGASKEVVFKFNVNSDVSGQQTFSIETRAGDKVSVKEVAVNIAPKASLFSGFGENGTIWIIGIVNVVLILLIIIVAVKLSRR